MAITLNSTWLADPSLHGDIYYVATSTNATSMNFKYIFDIKIGGNLVSRLRIFPDPATNKGICNVADVVRNYWASYFNPPSSPYLFNYNTSGIYVEYTLEVGEDNNGVITPNLATRTDKAYNYVMPVFTPDYNYLNSKIATYLTDRDLSSLVYYSGDLFICFYTSGFANRTITVNNGITNATYTTSFANVTFLNVSPAAINNTLGSTFITDATSQWTVTINNKVLTIKRNCVQHTPIPLHFLNESGGYDTFTFGLVNRQSRLVERKTFKQRGYGLIGDTMRAYDPYRKIYGGEISYATRQKVNYTLNSDYVNEKDYTWLRQLISSPEVYMEQNAFFYPIKVTDNNWTEKKRRNDKLFNLTLNVEVTETNSQYR